MNAGHLLKYVIRPVLHQLDESYPGAYGGEVAEALVLGTAITESNLEYLHQIGGGPAVGLWQMEPATFRDIWDNWLFFRADLAWLVGQMAIGDVIDERSALSMIPGAEELHGNLYLGAAMCRLHYKRVPEPLPDLKPYDLALYWKLHYNTPEGKGSVTTAIDDFRRAIDVVKACPR